MKKVTYVVTQIVNEKINVDITKLYKIKERSTVIVVVNPNTNLYDADLKELINNENAEILKAYIDVSTLVPATLMFNNSGIPNINKNNNKTFTIIENIDKILHKLLIQNGEGVSTLYVDATRTDLPIMETLMEKINSITDVIKNDIEVFIVVNNNPDEYKNMDYINIFQGSYVTNSPFSSDFILNEPMEISKIDHQIFLLNRQISILEHQRQLEVLKQRNMSMHPNQSNIKSMYDGPISPLTDIKP